MASHWDIVWGPHGWHEYNEVSADAEKELLSKSPTLVMNQDEKVKGHARKNVRKGRNE